MMILPKLTYRFSIITIKIPMIFFTEKIRSSQSNLEKESKAGRIMLHGFKLYYKALVNKTVWYRHEKRCVDQWNRIESPEINPHMRSTNI